MKPFKYVVFFGIVYFGDAIAAEGLIEFVAPDEARAVIERNEMQYEEHRWHSYPERIRIAKINIDLLWQSDTTISITPFNDLPSTVVNSRGINGSKWTGEKAQGTIPERALESALKKQGHPELFDAIVQRYNRVELRLNGVVKDKNTGEYGQLPADYEIIPAGQEIGDVFGNVPVFRGEDIEIVTQVSGTISSLNNLTGSGAPRSYSIKPLANDAEYVMIYEWDNSKNHHLMEPPHDPETWALSELGQKYERLRKEKDAYLAKVAARIAQREKQ